MKSTIFYHYTSISSLYEIVKNKTLLLSGVESLNDIEEASYSIQKFEDDFKTLCSSKNDDFIIFLYEQAFLPKRNEFEELASPEINPFVFSLSSKYDNLAHWDRYADSRKGVCIGFDISKISQIPFVAGGFVEINPIFYKAEERLDYLSKELHEKFTSPNNIIDFSDIPLELFCKDMGYTLISDCYRQMKYFVKNTSWEDEGEIRIAYEDTLIKDTFSKIMYLKKVYKNIQFPNFKELYKQSGLDIQNFRLINNKIRSCRFLDINSIWNSGFITEVMLGPKCEQNKRDLELFLKDSGLDEVKISESRIKIR